MRTQYEIGVIGAGNAAEGIVGGILRRSVMLDDRIIASDPSETRRRLFAQQFNIAVTDDNRAVVDDSYMILLAVKPQVQKEVVAGFADRVRQDHVIVSIMAGVSTGTLESQFPHIKARVIRVMPNLPIRVGAGMAGVFRGRYANDNDLRHAQRIFDSGGLSVLIEDEQQMNAVTAISGTGPAYFYYFVDALIAAGVEAGLPEEQARILAMQTCLGAARMMLETGEPPAVLREKVTSPGGTTFAAVESMKGNRVFDHIKEAVLAAHRRSIELGS